MIWIHVCCMLLSYAAFLLACVAGVLFLVQERQLKHKHMGSLFHRLPSLGALDRINFHAITAGFLLLSVGVCFGLSGIHRVYGHWWTGDSKEYLTVALWGWYCIVWLVRLRSTLRGRRVALLSVLGFSLVLFTGIGAGFMLSSVHPFL